MAVPATHKRHGRHYTPPELAGFPAGRGAAALAGLDDLVGRAFLGARGRSRPAHERTL